MKINKYEKFLLIQINGYLLLLLNNDIKFEDVEYIFLNPKTLYHIKNKDIREEFLDLFEEVMLLDALILFNKFGKEAELISNKISQILKENIEVEMDNIEIDLSD